jgi:DNA-binding MarR family transcriptional regulator
MTRSNERYMPAANRRRVSDIDALRTLAHPVRYRLLGHLMAVGPQTASQCAAVVGETPSNCSYHLRELARFGLVERVDDAPADGRERPWRSTATGWEFRAGNDDNRDDAVAAAANRRLQHAGVEEDARIAHDAIEELDGLEPGWRDASSNQTYGLRITADELVELTKAIDALVRPYIGLTREDAPPDARPVHVSFTAVRHPLV